MGEFPNIFITRDAPLVIKDAYGQMHYGTVYMDLGAYIEIRAGMQFIIDSLVFADEDMVSKAYVEQDYPTLDKGEKRNDWKHHIIVTGDQGQDGQNGQDGTECGDNGQNGQSADSGGDGVQDFTLIIYDLGFDVTILSIGGAGGNGGNGGNGAAGYDGTSESDIGGAGGSGGNGGNGGNGGDAVSMLTVKYGSTGGFKIGVDCVAAKGGNGGRGGIAGRNGKHYNGSYQPLGGSDGSRGIAGKSGKILVEMLSDSPYFLV
jgi:hypothetical protein